MNKMREAFEAWVKKEFGWEPEFIKYKDSDEFYKYATPMLQHMWMGYQAAIAAVKEGGIKAYEGMHTSGAPLYKLPEGTS